MTPSPPEPWIHSKQYRFTHTPSGGFRRSWLPCCKQLQAELTFLTHLSLMLTIVSFKTYHFLYKLSQQKSAKASWQIFIFCTLGLGTNGLIARWKWVPSDWLMLIRRRRQLNRSVCPARCNSTAGRWWSCQGRDSSWKRRLGWYNTLFFLFGSMLSSCRGRDTFPARPMHSSWLEWLESNLYPTA